MSDISLYEWFATWMSKISGRKFSRVAAPIEIVADLNGPIERYPWLTKISETAVYPLKRINKEYFYAAPVDFCIANIEPSETSQHTYQFVNAIMESNYDHISSTSRKNHSSSDGNDGSHNSGDNGDGNNIGTVGTTSTNNINTKHIRRHDPSLDEIEFLIPDLECRKINVRRASGQFYTPENLVHQLFQLTNLPSTFGDVIDPACGDGAWLVPLAEYWHNKGFNNSLERIWGFDLDPEALLICLARLLAVAPKAGWPNLQCRNFLLDPPLIGPNAGCTGFTAVIGNPPYKVNLDKNLRLSLEKHYETAEGEKDLYTFFLEGAVRILKPGGHLLMLTSHTYLVNRYCTKIRTFLFKHNLAKDLFLLPIRFFSKAPSIIPVVLHLQSKATSLELKPTKIYFHYDSKLGWKESVEIESARLCNVDGLRMALVPDSLKQVFERMKIGNTTLSEIARVGVGIQESLVRDGKVSKFVLPSLEERVNTLCVSQPKRKKASQITAANLSSVATFPSFSQQKAKKDNSIVHKVPLLDSENIEIVKVLRGREVQPFKIVWEGRFLYYGSHLCYAGDPEIFRKEKILYQNLRNERLPVRLVAAIDRDGFFPKNSLSFIACPKEPFSLYYLVGLLNSTLVNAWFAAHYFSFHITVGQVKSIPIPLADDIRRAKVETIVQTIMANENNSVSQNMQIELDIAVAQCYLNNEYHSELIQRTKKMLEQLAEVC